MQTFVQNHLGLVVVSVIMLLAAALLATASYYLRASGLPVKPVIFIGVFFAIVMVPQLAGQVAKAAWPKPKVALNAQAFSQASR